MPPTNQPSRGGNRPGAMTMAMQAAKAAQGPKVLRIGVIQGGKIIEERVIRARDTVSVGTTERNTFTIVAPDFPSHFELFQMSGGVYKLTFTDTMEGRVALPQGVQSLQQLRQSSQSQKVSVGWQIPLNEQCRGKVSFGDVTFLFQFVAPPPPQPKPQLPAAIRAGWVKNIDWSFNASLAFFLVCTFAAGAYIEYIYDPEVEDQFSLENRIITLVTPPQLEHEEEQAPAEQNTQQEQASNAEQPQQQPQQQQQQTASHSNDRVTGSTAQERAQSAQNVANRAAAQAQRAADAALARLNSSAEFAALVGAGEASGGAAPDRFMTGVAMTGTVAAFQGTNAIGTNPSGGRRGGMQANASGIGGGNQLGGARVTQGGPSVGNNAEPAQERQIRGSASAERPDSTGGTGELDPGVVFGRIRGAMGGIRMCYETALRNNPGLSGRVTVSFTIGESGAVTRSSANGLSNSNPPVAPCVASRVRSIRFPPPTDGSVDFSFPITFSPAN